LVTNGFFYSFYPIPILHYINNFCVTKGPVWLNELGSWIIYTTHTSLSPIRRGFAPGFVNYKKRCTRLATASDKVYQLLAHGRWFSPQALEFGPPFFPHLVPPAIMVWIFVWKYIFEPFIHILQHFALQLSRSTNFCFYVQLPYYIKV
jgi:hypothetical protein